MQPNILIFMTDQERGDVVLPESPCITPNAARLAQEGVTFREAYCPTAHCCPSRATFMTGLYPSKHGIFNNVSTPTAINTGLAEGVITFSEVLRDGGYHLAFSGKWHVTNEENPSDRGWEELVVTAGAGSYMHRSTADWQALKQADEDHQRKHGEVIRPGWGNYQLFDSYESTGEKGYEDHSDYPAIAAACEALPRLASSDQPWVLYVGPLGPHDPFIVPKQFVDMYDLDDIELPASYHDTLKDKPAIYQRMRQQYWNQLTETEVRDALRHYYAYCTMEDAMFGEVLDALEASGQADNTLVIFMSDHGEYCGAHGLYMKGVPAFKEAYNVPVIMRGPQLIQNPGRDVDHFISLADFAPTFIELAGQPIPDATTGHSLVPFLQDDAPSDWRDAHYTQFNGVELYYTQRAVTTKEYKYVYNGFDFDELYDLKNDPLEMNNLATDTAYDEIKHELVQKMWRFAAEEKDDRLFNPYGTVALAPWGPGDAL
ncbi:sulfatase-like hydrolase/transferase [Phototrophicus methaneseepsis]|uniref:Sulfatase-like hydrolase/transferase n=1 Tax=Phototrophicus methaneseepsis TaxID=2710758 RepID=A0A7S8EDG9_9CHLR|nr:sulfatase-like hydrolase/transferase [Phototrophicus methaneseepsis]QPC84967.1 sulfatase-like hydrolase/transferase [Phototrophicus methaneseepsis]